jgi:hypothetical protein
MASEKAPKTVEVVAEPPVVRLRAVELARAAGMFPAFTQGPKLRRAVENPEAWKYRAAKIRFGFGDEDQLTEKEFNARIAAVSTVLVR